MSYISGIVAAILSPLITTIGFLFWEYFCFHKHHTTTGSSTGNLDGCWSSFALNLYKCSFATILFIITIFILSIINNNNNNNKNETKYYFFWSFAPNDDDINNEITATNEQIIGYLILSSVIGIIIGDLLWLQALNLLGSVRVIFMDALKPFCATLFGILVFQESFRYIILLGIILTVTGILCMSLDPSQKSPQEQPLNDNHDATTTPVTETIGTDTKNNNTTAAAAAAAAAAVAKKKLSLKYTIGYSMSFINVVLDTYGSVLTKQYGINISVWEINCIRFGFAAGILLAISVMMILYNRVTSNHCWRRSSHENQGSTGNVVPNTNNNTQLELHTEPTDALSTIIIPKQNDVTLDVPWYMIPIGNKATAMMTKSVWLYISMGVVFVTYIAPTLYNYALFEISLALTLTLTSIGPFYAIPLSYAVQKYLYRSRTNIDHNTNHELQQQQPSQHENTKPKCPQLLEPQTPSKQVWIGATFTVAGIVVLAYFGGS